jgi:hypothetical protein
MVIFHSYVSLPEGKGGSALSNKHVATLSWFSCLPILLLVSCGLVWRYVGVTSIMPVETRDDVFFHKTVFSSLLWRVGKRLAKSCGDVSDDTHVTNQQMIAWSQSDSCPLRICTIQPFAALEFLVVNHCLLLRVLPALIFHNGFMYASKNANVHRYVWIHTYTHTNIYICVCVVILLIIFLDIYTY